MNWATRCPSCTTVFRVAEDQLRVSDGFVRCGRCDAVFDARSQLFDLNTGTPLQPQAAPEMPPPAPAPAAPSPIPEQTYSAPEPEERLAPPRAPASAGKRTEPGFAPTEWPHTHVDEPEPTLPPDCAYTAAVEAAAEAAAGPATLPTMAEGPGVTGELAVQRMRELLGDSAAPTEAPTADSPRPFASLESRPASSRWRRAGAWLGLSALALALPLQWAWIERNTLRAQWPALEAVWQRACGGCEPVLLTRLDGLVVASSSLQPTPQGQAYQLQLRVENRASHALRLPWVDLQLSDPAGRPLLRRSLSPAELGHSGQRLETGASVTLQATFKLDGRLAGYEVGLFHP